jgi:hypothetical protein
MYDGKFYVINILKVNPFFNSLIGLEGAEGPKGMEGPRGESGKSS